MKNILSAIIRCTLGVSAFALSFVAISSARAATEDRGQLASTVTVPTGLTKADVQEAIIVAFAGREWAVKEKADDHVVGYLKHRSNEATVTMVYDAAKVEIFCVGWKINKKTGERLKPEQPAGWLKYLQADMLKHLNMTLAHK